MDNSGCGVWDDLPPWPRQHQGIHRVKVFR